MTCSRLVLIMGCAASAGIGSACQDTQSAAPGELSAEANASNDLQPAPAPATAQNASDPAAMREAPADMTPVDPIVAPAANEDDRPDSRAAETPGEKSPTPQMAPDGASSTPPHLARRTAPPPPVPPMRDYGEHEAANVQGPER